MAQPPKRAVSTTWRPREFRGFLLAVALLAASFADRSEAAPSLAWSAFGRGNVFAPNAVAGLSGPQNPLAIAFDSQGNAYVTGTRFIAPYLIASYERGEFLTIKYNKANGAIEWRASAGAEITQQGTASAIAVDSQGNAYVTGGAATYVDGELRIAFLTLKYDSNGAEVWRASGGAQDDARANDIAIDGGAIST